MMNDDALVRKLMFFQLFSFSGDTNISSISSKFNLNFISAILTQCVKTSSINVRTLPFFFTVIIKLNTR